MRQRSIAAFFIGLVVIPLLSWGGGLAQAQNVTELQDQISERNNRLSQIEEEIAEYEAALQEVGAEKQTLQSAIDQLELERRKVLADLDYTEGKINATDLEISKLTIEIEEAEDGIAKNERAVAEIIREINVGDDDSMVELLLQHQKLSDFWNSMESLETVRNRMGDRMRELALQKEDLERKRSKTSDQRSQLVDLQERYQGQQQVLANNKAEKNELLEVTQNEEAKYQNLLAEKRAAREQITKELREFEAELQFILDPTTIPPRGTAVFDWPLDNILITQYFGGTEFAANNSGIYGRPYHPGVDFNASVGTPVKAPLSGTVRWTDNTDRIPGCYGWGKWILVDHANGLTTLYAHLNHSAVSRGDTVSTGDIIGYTGSTGYVTGPHLHFTVYAKDAVEVIKYSDFKTTTSCGPAYTPRAASEGYINPMDYLPAV